MTNQQINAETTVAASVEEVWSPVSEAMMKMGKIDIAALEAAAAKEPADG